MFFGADVFRRRCFSAPNPGAWLGSGSAARQRERGEQRERGSAAGARLGSGSAASSGSAVQLSEVWPQYFISAAARAAAASGIVLNTPR